MARGGINKAVVQKARLAILARGEHPSIDAVRVEMGNTGSKTTIHRYLKELDNGRSRAEAPEEPLEGELADLVVRIARRLEEQAQEPLEQAQAAFDERVQALETALLAAQQNQAGLEQQLDIQAAALAEESAALHSTRSTLQSEQTRNAGLNQAVGDFELRLQDKDEQIRSLEEKHLHARDALEHYRNAVKEQREQEQRRHEGQLQQVQMELRQVQQNALVRQDEITQLHRDNERLLSENRATVKELRQAQDLAQKSEALREQLQEQSNRAQGEATLLQERLRVALLESQTLKHSLEEQGRIGKELELRAAKAEAGLEALQLATAAKAAPATKERPPRPKRT